MLLNKEEITEIGLKATEVLGMPLALADLNGIVLYLPDAWRNDSRLQNREFLKSLVRKAGGREQPVVAPLADGVAVIVVPLYILNGLWGFAIVRSDETGGQDDPEGLSQRIDRELGGILLPVAGAAQARLDELKAEAGETVRRFQKGETGCEETLDSLLAALVRFSVIDTALVALIDDSSGALAPAHTAGDKMLVPNFEYLRHCGLCWWSLHEKSRVIVYNPQEDPRCPREAVHPETKAVGVWPLFVRDRMFGVLYLVGRSESPIEPWAANVIDFMAINMSLTIDCKRREQMNTGHIQKIKALSEISRVINSSLDLRTVLNLIADIAVTLFEAESCFVYLNGGTPTGSSLTVARGINPERLALLENRLREEESWPAGTMGLEGFPIRVKDMEIGCLCLGGFEGKQLTAEDRELIATFARIAGIAVENSRMFEQAQNTLMETITVLSLAIEARDRSMFGHSEKVRELAVALAEHLALPREEVKTIESASLLHDIGKLGIAESILNKTGPLTAGEYEEFKKHPELGADILRAVTSFEAISKIVRHHHERYDGSGYPDGLKGDEIPLGARILAIADTFASLISKRSYRSAHDPFESLEVIKTNAGKQFDPCLVQAFAAVVQKRYSFNLDLSPDNAEPAEGPPGLCAGEFGLTDREVEILAYIAMGLNNKEIAAALYLSEKTVKTHVTHILRKLKLPDRTKAAVFAIQKGLIKRVRVE